MLEKTIFLIEDEADLREILSEELTSIGYKVITAANGQEGLARIRQATPDLIICDRMMPGLSGYELLQQIRARSPDYHDIPFILFSSPPSMIRGIVRLWPT